MKMIVKRFLQKNKLIMRLGMKTISYKYLDTAKYIEMVARIVNTKKFNPKLSVGRLTSKHPALYCRIQAS